MMVDKSALSDILLFKQLDDDFRRDASGEEVKRGQQASEGRKKKLVVVKKVSDQLPEISTASAPAQQPAKKVIVARKVRLGDSPLPPLTKTDSSPSLSQNTNGPTSSIPPTLAQSSPSTLTQAGGSSSSPFPSETPFDQPDATVPLSIISRTKRGPKYDSENNLIERTVLGSVDDYLSYSKPTDATKYTTSHGRSTPERPRTAMDADELINIMKNMNINEKIRYLKEERALQRWERAVAEWERIKARMASKSGRDIDSVILSRSEKFREVMEQRELIERALATRDNEIIDLFATTLKTVGSPDKRLFMEMRQPSRDPMEVIGKPGTARSRPSSSYYSSRKQELQNSIDVLAPYDPDLNALSVVGTPLNRLSAASTVSPLAAFSQQFQNPSIASLSTYVHPPSTVNDTWSEDTPLSTPSASRFRGPMIQFEGATQDSHELRVVCEVAVGGLARAVLHAHNVGSTAVYYAWRKVEKERIFPIQEDPDASTQRFYFHDIKGVMLPSETHSFTFGFKSDNHGIFFEQWIFESNPALSTPGPTLTLKGIAVQEDDTAEARYQLEEAIGAKQINHGVQDIIRSIVDNIQPVVKPIPPLDDMDTEQEIFLRQNKGLHLYYSTELCKAFQQLARSVYEVLEYNLNWDFSVVKLNSVIMSVHDERLRSDFLGELNALIEQASVPKIPDTSIYYCMAYDLLVQLADRMPVISAALRESMTLPPVAFVPVEDDLRKVDSFGNLMDEKQKTKEGGKKKGGRLKRGSSPEKRQESPPKGKKKDKKDKEEESEDERNRSPVKKRPSRARQRERDPANQKDKDKDKEKEKDKEREKEEREREGEKAMAGKEATPQSRRAKKKKPEGDEDKKSEEEEDWSDDRKAKEAEYKVEFTHKVKGLVWDTFTQFQLLAKEADVLTNRVAQDFYFDGPVSASVVDPLPLEKLLESEFAPPEEAEESPQLQQQQVDTNRSNLSFARTASAHSATQDAAGAESDAAQDARSRRRRRVQNRKQ